MMTASLSGLDGVAGVGVEPTGRGALPFFNAGLRTVWELPGAPPAPVSACSARAGAPDASSALAGNPRSGATTAGGETMVRGRGGGEGEEEGEGETACSSLTADAGSTRGLFAPMPRRTINAVAPATSAIAPITSGTRDGRGADADGTRRARSPVALRMVVLADF